MLVQPLPKPQRIRSRKAIAAARKQRCEYCHAWGPTEVHHLRSRGAGGEDSLLNLVALCRACHRRFHDGHIPREQLVILVAHREDLTPEQVRRAIGWEAP